MLQYLAFGIFGTLLKKKPRRLRGYFLNTRAAGLLLLGGASFIVGLLGILSLLALLFLLGFLFGCFGVSLGIGRVFLGDCQRAQQHAQRHQFCDRLHVE